MTVHVDINDVKVLPKGLLKNVNIFDKNILHLNLAYGLLAPDNVTPETVPIPVFIRDKNYIATSFDKYYGYHCAKISSIRNEFKYPDEEWFKHINGLNTCSNDIAHYIMTEYCHRYKLEHIDWVNGEYVVSIKSFSDYVQEYFETQPAIVQYIKIIQKILKLNHNVQIYMYVDTKYPSFISAIVNMINKSYHKPKNNPKGTDEK